MWDAIGDIFVAAGEVLSAAGRPTQKPSQPSEPSPPSRLGLPVGVVCAAGAAGSIYAMFFQGGDWWQIAKLLLLALILGVCSTLGFHSFGQRRHFRARQRAAAGLCARCGYDLRGNTSGVCPECGVPRWAGWRRARPRSASKPIRGGTC